MGKIKIGKIVTAVGMKGEVKVYSYSADPERFESLDSVEINGDDAKIENVRYKANTPIIKFSTIPDRTAAERMRSADVFMDEEDLPDPGEGSHYVRDIVGFDVVYESGEVIGTLKDVRTETAQDLYIVDVGEKEIFVPGVKEFIRRIDTEERKITVRLPKGLTEL